mgnify:CR=1 FL=1
MENDVLLILVILLASGAIVAIALIQRISIKNLKELVKKYEWENAVLKV